MKKKEILRNCIYTIYSYTDMLRVSLKEYDPDKLHVAIAETIVSLNDIKTQLGDLKIELEEEGDEE